MKEETKLNRRKFGASVVAALTAGTAGCNQSQENDTETDEDTDETAPGSVAEQTFTEDDTSTGDIMSDEDIEQALEATAYNLNDELYMRGFEPGSFKMVDVGESRNGETDYELRVEVDLDSVFHTSGMTVRGQDLHTSSELGLTDDIFQDVRSQLHEMANIVAENLGHFYDEVGDREEAPVRLTMALDGENRSEYGFNINTAEQELETELEEFIDEPADRGYHSFHPMEYEQKMLIGQGEERTLELEDEEHTIEYLNKGVFSVDGEMVQKNKTERFQLAGEDVIVSDIDPIYLQEREEVDGAAELYIPDGPELEY